MDEDLIEHWKKCRFCFGKIKSTRLAVHISQDIEQNYFSLTNSKLKTSENYSSVICKTCLKDLESSVGFQQKIIVNQQRLEKFEFGDTVPVKEEAFEAEDLKTVEIKTECFEFEPAFVVQSWQEPIDKCETEGNLKDASEEWTDSNGVLKAESFRDDSSESSLFEELIHPVKKTQAVDYEMRICPYCAGFYSKVNLNAHIERHENEINNTPLLCELCDYRCFRALDLKRHHKRHHPETLPQKAAKKKITPIVEFANQAERKNKIIETFKTHPEWTIKKIARTLGVGERTVGRLKKILREKGTVERRKGSGRPKGTTVPKELHKEIVSSFHHDPLLTFRQRAKLFGITTNRIHRIAQQIGFKVEVDDSNRKHQCTLCPSKYKHKMTLNAHMKEKHQETESK